MILKQEYFKYPTKKEISKLNKEIPIIDSFNFKHSSLVQLMIEYNLTNQELYRIDNLSNWDVCLKNRFAKLRQTFEYLLVHFSRGISKDYKSDSPIIITNTILFEYYIEIFYYFYFSSLDIIAQIINLYFNLDINENKVDFGKIAYHNTPIKSTLEEISNDNAITDAIDNRNAFTHRYTPTMNDIRSSYLKIDDRRFALGIGGNKEPNFDSINTNSKEIMLILARLMKDLINFIKKDTENNTYLFH